MPMKILFLTETMSGGGAERVVSLISRELSNRGHEVLLMTDIYKTVAFNISEKVKTLPLFKQKKYDGLKRIFSMVFNTRETLKKEKPDIIIGVLPVMNFVAILASIKLGVKVIASDHTSFDRKFSWPINFIRNHVYQLADAVTILTQADYDYLGKRLPRKVVMPNPLAFSCITDVCNERKKNILAVGRLDVWKVKGFDILMEAWSNIEKKFPEWQLDIAGWGGASSLNELKDMAKGLRISERINFLGFRKDIDAVMRESSIFALPSRVEGFGMVLIEAMSQGCACVSFDDGGRQREIIIDDADGILLEDRSVESLSKALVMLMENESIRKEVAKNGIRRAYNYNILKIVDMWEQLIERTIMRNDKKNMADLS